MNWFSNTLETAAEIGSNVVRTGIESTPPVRMARMVTSMTSESEENYVGDECQEAVFDLMVDVNTLLVVLSGAPPRCAKTAIKKLLKQKKREVINKFKNKVRACFMREASKGDVVQGLVGFATAMTSLFNPESIAQAVLREMNPSELVTESASFALQTATTYVSGGTYIMLKLVLASREMEAVYNSAERVDRCC